MKRIKIEIDSYTKDWYNERDEELKGYELPEHIHVCLMSSALKADVNTTKKLRTFAENILKGQKCVVLAKCDIEHILNILF